MQERRKNELDALTAGTFIHSVLQCFAELVRRRGGFRALENAGELIDQVVEDYRKEHFPDFEESGGCLLYTSKLNSIIKNRSAFDKRGLKKERRRKRQCLRERICPRGSAFCLSLIHI